MQKYHLDFILRIQGASPKAIKNSLSEFGEDVEVIDSCQDSGTLNRDLKINLDAEDPTVIFDICSQFGRIKTVKVTEGG